MILDSNISKDILQKYAIPNFSIPVIHFHYADDSFF